MPDVPPVTPAPFVYYDIHRIDVMIFECSHVNHKGNSYHNGRIDGNLSNVAVQTISILISDMYHNVNSETYSTYYVKVKREVDLYVRN